MYSANPPAIAPSTICPVPSASTRQTPPPLPPSTSPPLGHTEILASQQESVRRPCLAAWPAPPPQIAGRTLPVPGMPLVSYAALRVSFSPLRIPPALPFPHPPATAVYVRNRSLSIRPAISSNPAPRPS